MAVELIRIDDRLIHGQVIVGWIPNTKADEVICINDTVASNEMQKCLMKMAVPPNLQAMIYSVDGFNLTQDSAEITEHRVVIIVTNPADLVRLFRKGFKFDKVNLGGMRHSVNKKEYSKSVFLNEKDIADFHELKKLGVRVTYQMVPTDKPQDLFECLLKGACPEK